jgi:arylsulfatase
MRAGRLTLRTRGRIGVWTMLGALALAACQPGAAPADAPGSGEAADPEPARRPHIVLISLDTLRADRLGAYGCERPTSPVMDRFAAEGVRFAEAVAPSSKTATSHTSMFTGVHPRVHGVRNYYGKEATAPNEGLVNLAEALADEGGYVCAAFTGGGMMSGELGFERGFTEYDDRGAGADRVFGRTKAWLEQRWPEVQQSEVPLFLFVHTYEIHDPYTPPAEWAQRFVDPNYSGGVDATRIEMPDDAIEAWKNDPTLFKRIQDGFWGQFDGRKPEDVQYIKDLYDAGIAYTDYLLGDLLENLQDIGLLDEALVVITSDHGEEFLDHGLVSHQTVYQEILHVPLLVRLPVGHPQAVERRGAVVPRPVMGADLFPSLLDFAGIEVPDYVQGQSWVPSLLGEITRWELAWSEIGTPANDLVALRWGGYKLIGNRVTRRDPEFYDLQVDPREQFNRMGDFGDVAVHMAGLMQRQDERNALLAKRFPAVPTQVGEAGMGAMHALGYVDGPAGGVPPGKEAQPVPTDGE